MKKYIFIATAILSVFSCDDKADSLEELNIAPDLEYFVRTSTQWEQVSETGVVLDSAKVWTETNNINFPAVLRAPDVNLNFGEAIITSLDNDLTFFIDDELFQNGATVMLDSFAIAVRNIQPTRKSFSLEVIDTWGKSETVTFDIDFFENKPPISRLELLIRNENAVNEYELNASESFDRDQSIGGFIIEYEYTIDGIISTIPTPTIRHVFSPGDHTVSVRVRDNDGAWSEQVTRNLNIN